MGTLPAKGGAEKCEKGEEGGGGGGGRISFSYGSSSLSGHTVTVAGGPGTPARAPYSGGDGTINGL